MSSPNRGLGRGLDSLLGEDIESLNLPAQTVPTSELDIDKIVPNPQQPRRQIDPTALEELAASIRSQGLIQPIVVRPVSKSDTFEIIAGERRWRAAKMVGLTTIPVHVREMSDAAVMLAALIENLQREDLNPLEEALALKDLREKYHLTQEDIAQKIGKARTSVSNTLRLLTLSPEAQDDLRHGRLTAGHARALLSINRAAAQEELRRKLVEEKMSVREAEEAATHWKNAGAFPWERTLDTTPRTARDTPKTVRGSGGSPELEQWESRLNEALGVPTTLHGNTRKGKVTIHYANTDQLLALLRLLGVDTGEA